MLKRLLQFSIDNSVMVLAAAALLLGFAVYQTQKAPVDVFPELNAPTVVVLTETPGYAADEVEQFVTFPIESSVNIPVQWSGTDDEGIAYFDIYVSIDGGPWTLWLDNSSLRPISGQHGDPPSLLMVTSLLTVCNNQGWV